MKKDKYFVGTELKIAINIDCQGFDMDNDDWTATVKKGSKSIGSSAEMSPSILI